MEKNFLLGVVLVAAGLLLLLSNFGILPTNLWPLLLRFWPLLLICTGLLLVDQKGKWGMYLSLALIVALLAGIIYFSYSGGTLPDNFHRPGYWR